MIVRTRGCRLGAPAGATSGGSTSSALGAASGTAGSINETGGGVNRTRKLAVVVLSRAGSDGTFTDANAISSAASLRGREAVRVSTLL
ncbi:hypothetical protein ACFQZC_17360 [Streptacidiphilus monticola]